MFWTGITWATFIATAVVEAEQDVKVRVVWAHDQPGTLVACAEATAEATLFTRCPRAQADASPGSVSLANHRMPRGAVLCLVLNVSLPSLATRRRTSNGRDLRVILGGVPYSYSRVPYSAVKRRRRERL
jgi:hypothetical protein